MSAEPKFTSIHLDVEQGPLAHIFEPASHNKPDTPVDKPSRQMVDNRTKLIRFGVILIGIVLLIVGRTSVPDHDVPCIVDRLMNVFDDLNNYVVNSPFLRNFMLIVCSLFMDITFLSTAIYWIFYGTTSRVVVSLLLFYGTRALVQLMWYSPIPAGYYWEYPGFPSLVVPYGRSTDFFFSGHIGFVVINASEWFKNGKPWLTAVLAMGGLYTAFVMLVFQGHYSIDIFTGIVVAALIFMIVDKYKEKIDGFFHLISVKVGNLFKKKNKKEKKDLSESFLDSERQ